jgi:DNA polymerase-3 subunit epsilon
MRYAVVDVETTGFSPVHDRVVEIACVLVEHGRIGLTWSTLINPDCEIPAYATAVHGISDDDVKYAPRLHEVSNELQRFCAGTTIAAHNAAFDLSFLPMLAHLPSLCTLKLARQCFPQAPNHKNQTLREYLHIPLRGLAHRALTDALVTAHVLLRCLQRPEHAA